MQALLGVVVVAGLVGCADRAADEPPELRCAEGASAVDGVCRCEAAHEGAICDEGGGGVRRFCAGAARCVSELPIPNVVLATPDERYYVGGAAPCSAGVSGWLGGLAASGSRIAMDGTMPIVMGIGRPLGTGCAPVHVFACPDGTCDATTTIYGGPLNYGDQPTVLPYLIGVVDGDAIMMDKGNLIACPTTGCSSVRTLATGLDTGTTFARTDAMGTALAATNRVTVIDGTTHVNLDTPRLVTGLALDDDRVFWTTENGVYACPRHELATCTPALVAPGSNVKGIVVDDDNIYWADDFELMICAKDGCMPRRLLTCGPDNRPEPPLSGLSYLESSADHIYCPGFATEFPYSTLEVPK